MNATELATLSMTELRSMCATHGIEPVGDKRSKATWVLAMTQWQIEVAPAVDVPDYQPIESPFELVIKSESIDPPLEESVPEPSPQPPAPKPYRQASIVALVALLLFGTAFLVVRIGFTSLVWVIASLEESREAITPRPSLLDRSV